MGKDEKGGNMSKIAGDINAEMMKKAIHDNRAKLFAEIVGKTGSQQSVIDCAMQEIESLRQQLADSLKREVMLREALEKCRDQQVVNTTTFQIATKALAASVDLENVRLCEKEPVAWLNNGEAYPYPEGLPLYRAWEPKP